MPQDGEAMNVIMHKQTKKSASGRFMPVGKYAIMTVDDFMQLVRYRRGFEIMKAYFLALDFRDQYPSLYEKLKEIGLI
jgi:hypothetical protein